MLRILIVDDTRLYLDALAGLLKSEPQVGTIETAQDPHEILRRLTTSALDVVLLHARMAGSTEILHAVTQATRKVPVVALGVGQSEDEVVTLAEAGVAGYLFREQSLIDLLAVVQSVTRGEMLCPPRIAATLLRRITTLASERISRTRIERLTPREQEILQLIDESMSNKEIARRLSIEVRTVKNHVHNILDKLQVHRRAEAAARIRGPR
jgi:two-component system nitrate/nitrite response regulator NarL